ncbi:hypothetical protein IKE71_03005 [Candidatus Saccharibacteria bacterium]|nr:hypothetical protein [Candidatus Saccharibacteria bacterium]
MQPIKQINAINRCLGISFAGLAVLVLGFIFAPTLISEASATENVATAVSWDVVSLTLDPGGDVNFGEVVPSSRDISIGNFGTQKVVKKNVTVTTNGDYYAVYLSTFGENNALKTSSDTVQAIPPIGNRAAGADSSSFATTSWGFAIPTSETASIFSAYDDFLVNPADTQANNLTKLGTGSVVYNTGLWSAVPTLSNVSLIHQQSTNVATGFSSGDNFPIYYSIMIDTDTMAGTYENQVVYTAIARAGRGDISYNVSRDKDIATSYPGEMEVLRIDLAVTNSGLTPALATSDLEIRLVPHNVIANNNYSVVGLVATDYPICVPASVTSEGQSAEIGCSLPLMGAKGSTDIAGDHVVTEGSTYDFWVKVTLPDTSTVDYVSHYKEDTTDVASLTYKTGLQSINTSGDFLITKMQQMTGSVCLATNMWNSQTGSSARIYDYRGQDGDNPLLAVGADANGVSSFILTDTRDSKPYLIRRLADGDCWMVQNLNLDLATVGTITTANTDISSNWTPSLRYGQTGTAYGDDSEIFVSMYDSKYKYYDASEGAIKTDDSYNQAHATSYFGNYYTSSAVTAEKRGSICPTGWQIPNLSRSGNLNRSLANLVARYGIEQNSLIAEHPEIRQLPLSFGTTGYSYNYNLLDAPESRTMIFIGEEDGYNFYFDVSHLLQFANSVNAKSSALVVRCVAR